MPGRYGEKSLVPTEIRTPDCPAPSLVAKPIMVLIRNDCGP